MHLKINTSVYWQWLPMWVSKYFVVKSVKILTFVLVECLCKFIMYVYIYIKIFYILNITLFFYQIIHYKWRTNCALQLYKKIAHSKKKTCVDVLHLKIKYKQLALVNIQVFVIFPKKKKEKKVVVIICASDWVN